MTRYQQTIALRAAAVRASIAAADQAAADAARGITPERRAAQDRFDRLGLPRGAR